MAEMDLEGIQKQLGVRFQDESLLQKALTHRSVVGDDPTLSRDAHNERLEFLGDAVLSLVTAEEVYAKNPYADEGVLSQLRALYVCEANLVEGANRVGLGAHIRVAKAMRASGPVNLPSVLADAIEAVFGAIYLDAGYDAAKEFILKVLGPIPDRVVVAQKDAKTELQEKIQAAVSLTPFYTVVSSSGPAHTPVFEVEASVANHVIGRGQGPSKKDAAQEAAKDALERIRDWNKARFESEFINLKK